MYRWPPFDQASTIGSKWQLIENLELIHPSTMLKRTHSESSNHVIFPNDLEKRNWEYLNTHSEIPRCRWFAQSYIKSLKDLGEWRVILVGGSPVYTIHTQPGTGDQWKHRRAVSFWPLERLR